MRRLFVLYFGFVLAGAAQVSRQAVVAELNYARQQPQAYAGLIQEWVGYFRDRLLMLPGRTMMTREGAPAASEAVRVLRSMKPMQAVSEFAPLDQAANDLIRDQGPRGALGHTGSDGSEPWDRMRRHAQGITKFGEANAYGPVGARFTIIRLLVDDGVPDRGHRQVLLDPAYRFVGVGLGPHARQREMCVIDLAK